MGRHRRTGAPSLPSQEHINRSKIRHSYAAGKTLVVSPARGRDSALKAHQVLPDSTRGNGLRLLSTESSRGFWSSQRATPASGWRAAPHKTWASTSGNYQLRLDLAYIIGIHCQLRPFYYFWLTCGSRAVTGTSYQVPSSTKAVGL